MGFWSWLFGEDPETPTPALGSGGSTAVLEPPTSQETNSRVSASQNSVASEAASDESSGSDTREDYWWDTTDEAHIEPVAITQPELPASALAFENVLVSHFDGHNLSMPPLPGVAQRVLGELSGKNSSLTKIAGFIAEDQVMAAAVLRLANSPLYRGVDRIEALLPAVTRLGSNALRTLMMHESLRETLFKDTDGELAELLWTRALAAAHTMRTLAPLVRMNPEDAFLIGLLHDIGNVITLRIAHENQAFVRYGVDLESFEYFCHECHQEFGELVANAWSLPDNIKTLVADHHGWPADDDALRSERLLIILADMITAALGYAQNQPYDLYHAKPAEALSLAGTPRYLSLLTQLPDTLDELLGSKG